MIHINVSGYNIFLYGYIIKYNNLFKLENQKVFEEISDKINDSINIPEMFLLLNKSFSIVEPKDEKFKHEDIIVIPEKYKEIKISNIKGTGKIIIDNIIYTVDEFIKKFDDKFISDTKIVAIESNITYDIGII
jgi:hypothetical protein